MDSDEKKFYGLMVLSCIFIIFVSFIPEISEWTKKFKVVNVEQKTVEVTIVDEYHRGIWIQPIFNEKTTTYIHHPAVYHITVKYNDLEYVVEGKDTYYKYKDKIGQTAIGTLEIRSYDDGSTNSNIINLN